MNIVTKLARALTLVVMITPIGSWAQAFGLEVVATFILMFVILGVSTGAKEKGLLLGLFGLSIVHGSVDVVKDDPV